MMKRTKYLSKKCVQALLFAANHPLEMEKMVTYYKWELKGYPLEAMQKKLDIWKSHMPEQFLREIEKNLKQ